jgi:hypothetical protein
MVLLVAAGVVADRVVANRTISNPGTFVPAYRSFQEFVAGQKLRQVADEGGFPNVFIGNSRTLFGINPDVFDARTRADGVDVRSYNLAMPTVDPRFWDFFFTKFYDERAPKRVFYGITPRDLDSRNHTAESYQAAFAASPGFSNRNRTGIWKWSEEELAQLFTLRGRIEETKHFNRRDFFRPAGQRDNLRQFMISGDRGYSRYPARYTKTPEFLRRDMTRYANRPGAIRLRPGRDRVRALEALDRWVRDRGGCLTFFSVPVLYDPEPWGGQKIRRDFTRFMRDFVRRHPDTEFVNTGGEVEKSYGVADYGDADHLNPRGAAKFSRQLADAIAPGLRRDCKRR